MCPSLPPGFLEAALEPCNAPAASTEVKPLVEFVYTPYMRLYRTPPTPTAEPVVLPSQPNLMLRYCPQGYFDESHWTLGSTPA